MFLPFFGVLSVPGIIVLQDGTACSYVKECLLLLDTFGVSKVVLKDSCTESRKVPKTQNSYTYYFFYMNLFL